VLIDETSQQKTGTLLNSFGSTPTISIKAGKPRQLGLAVGFYQIG
jgi:hypothetical protein